MELAVAIAEAIGRCAEPLIGLRHIYVYRTDDGLVIYWCGLCELMCGQDSPSVLILHVTTRKHRTGYMKLNYLNYFDIVQSNPDDTSLLVEYTRIIEADEGRQNVRISDGPIPTLVLNAYQAEKAEKAAAIIAAQGEVICLGQSSIGQLLHKIALKAEAKNVGELLHPLIPSLITTEDEAAKALEVANRLTRSLLEYRLNSSPRE